MTRMVRTLAVALLVGLSLAVARAQEGEKTLVLDAPPADWKVEKGHGMMAPKAAYELPAAEGDSEGAKVTLHHFPGMGGTVDDNVKRWCGQFTDKDGNALDPAKVTREKVDVKGGLKVTLVDLAGTYHAPAFMGGGGTKPGWRLLAAVVETEDGPWFARIIGPEKTVAKQKDAFMTWLKSARYEAPAKAK